MNEPTEEARDKLEEILKTHAIALAEFFENVQIFVSNREEGGDDQTISFRFGMGNIHARMNQCRQWVIRNDEATRAQARKDYEEDEEED